MNKIWCWFREHCLIRHIYKDQNGDNKATKPYRENKI